MLARKYESTEMLSGHTNSITVLLFSPNSKYLASGCKSGIVLVTATESWEVAKRLVNVSPVTALLWDPTFPMTVVCGFASGAILTVHIGDSNSDRSDPKVWTDSFDGPIYCISSDNLGRMLAIGHGCKITLLDQKTLSDPAHWENIRTLPSPPEFTAGLPAPSLWALHFTKEGHLIATYLDHGIVLRLLGPIIDFACSGWSTISPGEKHIIVLNLFDGLDFYSIADRALSHLVPCPINQQKNAPVPVLFNSDGSTIVVGGTSGSMRVLDSSSCDLIQAIVHASDQQGYVTHSKQDLCMTQEGIHIIAAGVLEQGDETTIKVWISQPVPEPQLLPPRSFVQESGPVDRFMDSGVEEVLSGTKEKCNTCQQTGLPGTNRHAASCPIMSCQEFFSLGDKAQPDLARRVLPHQVRQAIWEDLRPRNSCPLNKILNLLPGWVSLCRARLIGEDAHHKILKGARLKPGCLAKPSGSGLRSPSVPASKGVTEESVSDLFILAIPEVMEELGTEVSSARSESFIKSDPIVFTNEPTFNEALSVALIEEGLGLISVGPSGLGRDITGGEFDDGTRISPLPNHCPQESSHLQNPP
ncbi:hypothetical protein BDM02DRAFT_3130194 [Thelephora ganbajun]|uniref:Uncharacterized protein n=1 Tax=Thelephora ganbajun TaxID=370292 RepID=A0ACB6ZB01_THEGA|nr:hypothetical protein BDM02DRAFT_3130194 [Thelephora ganbajun]